MQYKGKFCFWCFSGLIIGTPLQYKHSSPKSYQYKIYRNFNVLVGILLIYVYTAYKAFPQDSSRHYDILKNIHKTKTIQKKKSQLLLLKQDNDRHRKIILFLVLTVNLQQYSIVYNLLMTMNTHNSMQAQNDMRYLKKPCS